MRPLKRILKSPHAKQTIIWLAASYIRLVFKTARIEMNIHPASMPYVRGEDNAIFAFWHGRMMMMPNAAPKKRDMHVMISRHNDGLMISGVIHRFGLQTIAGSSSRGAKAATVQALRLLKAGHNISITPDGPRGPNQVAAPGVASIAKLSGKAVIPVSFGADRKKHMKSWDRFLLAYPFCAVGFFAGEPIFVAQDQDEEQARQHIESAMNQITEAADAAFL